MRESRFSQKMIPDVFLRLFRKIRRDFSEYFEKTFQYGITYQGFYSNFNEVLPELGDQVQYSTSEQFDTALKLAKELLYNSDTYSFVNLGWASQRLNFLPNFISTLNLDRLKILDVGGGFGETYLNLRRRVLIDVQYDIIELEKTVEAGKEIFRNCNNLNFYTSNSYSPSNYDLVYFGSSLQYFEDWKAIIELAFVSHPKYILISDTTVGEVPTFVCAQVNDPRIIIPRWVFNIQDLDNTFLDSSYTRVLRTSNYYPFHNFFNYEGDYKNIQHTNLVYKAQE